MAVRRTAPLRAERLGGRPLAAGGAPPDDLARPLRALRARVGDHVAAVDERAVVALAAGDAVDLAVAGAEAVVARAAVERVADLVVARLHVARAAGAQDVVALAAVRDVDALGEADDVVAAVAVLGVVARRRRT